LHIVKKNSGDPATVIIDLEQYSKMPHLPGSFTAGDVEKVIQNPQSLLLPLEVMSSSKRFIAGLKTLVESNLIQCLFAASDGFAFQEQSLREPRLNLFMAYELSVSQSQKYLKNQFDISPEEELFYKIPRTFLTLNRIGNLEGIEQKVFADSLFETEIERIKRYELTEEEKQILKKVLEHGEVSHGELGENKSYSIQSLLSKNILTLTLNLKLKFQFDVTAAAVKISYY